MSNKCIVSFGKGHNFTKGLKRLEINVKQKLNIPFFKFDEYPEGCPVHAASPFAFKFFCINECRKKGYDVVFWMDSSVIIKNNMDDIFKLLDTQGYFFIKNWHSVGEYCHDKALDTLNITREESFNIPCVQGTQFGLNFSHNNANQFLNKVLEYSNDGITFPGPYTNKDNIASIDNKVAGHRHDQIAMSVVSLRCGMNNWWPHEEHKWFIHDRKFVKNVESTVTDVNMASFDIKKYCNDNLKYKWEPAEIITGDNLKSLGDYVFDVDNYIKGDHGRVKTHKNEGDLATEQINEINNIKPKIIYVYGHDIDLFLKYSNDINHKFDLISHNSDIGIPKDYQSSNINKWFGQNNYAKDKAISLPIGIARKKYEHGNVNLISKYSENSFKDILVYKNFSIGTNHDIRSEIDNITSRNGIPMSCMEDQNNYLDFISRSIFCISPPGNGIDCHRIWECLYLKCIPIVKSHHALEQFKNLPIMFIDDWNDITIDFLKANVNKIKGLNIKHDELNFNYWKSKIKNEK
jgi:hypothetical protein